MNKDAKSEASFSTARPAWLGGHGQDPGLAGGLQGGASLQAGGSGLQVQGKPAELNNVNIYRTDVLKRQCHEIFA